MLKRPLITLLFFQLAFLNSISGENQQDYKKGWEAFSGNDRVEARKYFNQASANPETKSDALLSLCLLDWNEFKYNAAFEDFRQFYTSSSNPYPYLYAMSSLPFLFDSSDILAQNRVDFFEKIAADPKLNGTLKAMICERLGSYYEGINNFKKAKELYAKMGALNRWQVLGTFDNTSGSGFSKDWGAVGKSAQTDVFKNKVDADIKWFTPTCNKPNNWFHFEYYFVLNSTIIYTQTFVNSPLAQEVYLRAGNSGSLKIWVNDALVSTISDERNCDLDIYAYKIKLNKGANRILVQTGQSEIDNANILIRLTDANANPIPGLTDSEINAEYTKSTDQPTNELLPFFAEKFHTDKVSESPSNPLYYYMLAETYLHNDKAYEATKVLKKLEETTSTSTLCSYRLAEAYSRAKNRTDYDKEMGNIKRLDPNSFLGLQESYNEAVKSEKYTDAEDICKKAKELYGENPTTDEWEINIASYQKRYQDVMAMAKTFHKKYPSKIDYMKLNFTIEKNTSKNPKSAVAIIENFCKSYFNSSALDLLSKTYIEQGNSEKGLAVLKQRLDNMPYATGYWDDLTSVLFRMQKYKEALATTDQMLALSPTLSGVYNTRGYIYKNLKEENNAIDNFKKSIYYGPTSYDSRSQLRLLQNKKELNELFPKKDLNELIKNAPSATQYPQDNSIILLNDYQSIIYPEAAKEYRYEIAVKILNQSGIENWKEYNVGYNDNTQKLIIDKVEVIKSNGTKVKAETNNDNKVVFTNLEVNDVLHLIYRVQDFSTGKLAKHFFDHFLFQYNIPSLINRYSVLAPKDKTFDYLITNGKVEPKITEVEDMKLYQWELDNQAAVKTEPFMSALTDVAPTFYCSSIPNWRYVSDWYKDLTYSKFNTDYVLKETVASILKNKENSSQIEKAKLFYNYILENISYSNVAFLHSNFVPQKASRTITTRLGDCKDVSTLFVALCNEVGIKANLVLISTRNNGNKTMPLPSVEFNHCIAQLNLDNKTYYLELTDNKLPFGSALTIDLKSQILPIPFTNESYGDKLLNMDMPFRLKNSIKRFHNITLSNSDLIISRKSVYVAEIASSLRETYRDIGSDEQLKHMSQAVASDFTVPIKITDLTFQNLDNLQDSLMINYKVEVKNVLQTVAGMKILNLPWTEKISSLEVVTSEARKYPIEFWSYMMEDINNEEINITLPTGKKFVELPVDVSFDCANASYKLTFDTRNPGKIIGHRTMIRKSEQITPAEYPAFRDFINRVSESDNKSYAIK
jgi:predicted Zn-dependent protease